MLTITFPKNSQPKVRAIIADVAVNDITGIVECTRCGQAQLISEGTIKGIAESVEQFAYGHGCGRIPNVKQKLLKAIKELHDASGGGCGDG